MYSKYGHPEDNYVATIYEDIEDGAYIISFHHSEIPALDYRTFGTLEETKSWAESELGITHWRGFDGQFTARPD